MTIGVKAILPKKKFNPTVFQKRYRQGMDEWGKLVEKDFLKTVATWKGKPDFENVTTEVVGLAIETEVSTRNLIYHFVNDGTKRHAIFAGAFTGKSNKKSLAFSSKFVPKTKKGFIGSNQGGSGEIDTFTPFVDHPGTEARLFNVAIKGKRTPDLIKIMNKATSTANRESGYSME